MNDLSQTDTDNGEKDRSQAQHSTHPYQNRETSLTDSSQDNPDEDDGRHYTLLGYYELTLPLISGESLQSLKVHSCLRTLVDFSLSHSFQLRALQKREIKFADLSLDRLRPIPILVVKSIFPKTTQIQYTACVRHKLVELCPQFILSMYLFARFHIKDTNGEMDLTSDSIHDDQFLDYKLLNGGKKLRPLSYSQQYKASTKILKFMEDFKPVNLGRILTSQYNDDPKLGCIHTSAKLMKPLSSSIESIQIDVLCKLAGFEVSLSYKIERSQREPPLSVVRQIFPFLNDHDFLSPSRADDFILVLDSLRRSLVQDMVEIRRRFPYNLLCDHPIFKSAEFIEFAGVSEISQQKIPKDSSSDDEQVSPPEEDFVYAESESVNTGTDEESDGRTTGKKRPSRSQMTREQNKRIKTMETVIDHICKQQENLKSEIFRFMETHATQLASQCKSITNLIDTTNGLSVLLTAKSINSVNYVRQVLDENASSLEHIHAQIAGQQSDILRSKEAWNSRLNYSSSTFNKNRAPSTSGQTMPTLLSNLSTISETWDDYKNWEKELIQQGITKEEWLRHQPAATIQLQETKKVVVNFIQEMAKSRLLPVSIVIEKLLRLMRQHTLPPSVPELSKKIVEGFRVDLD